MLPLDVPDAIVLAAAIVAAALVYAAHTIARRLPGASAHHASALLPQFPIMEFPQTEAGAPVEPSGLPVGPDTILEPGDTVLAFSQERWWRAEVVRLEPGDRVRLHFPGWDAKWDDVFPRNDLQVDLTGPEG